jgi:ActR/RegA family two-component response regulator
MKMRIFVPRDANDTRWEEIRKQLEETLKNISRD